MSDSRISFPLDLGPMNQTVQDDTTIGFQELPNELIERIFLFLETPLSVCRVSLVCKLWRDITLHEPIKNLSINHFSLFCDPRFPFSKGNEIIRKNALLFGKYFGGTPLCNLRNKFNSSVDKESAHSRELFKRRYELERRYLPRDREQDREYPLQCRLKGVSSAGIVYDKLRQISTLKIVIGDLLYNFEIETGAGDVVYIEAMQDRCLIITEFGYVYLFKEEKCIRRIVLYQRLVETILKDEFLSSRGDIKLLKIKDIDFDKQVIKCQAVFETQIRLVAIDFDFSSDENEFLFLKAVNPLHCLAIEEPFCESDDYIVCRVVDYIVCREQVGMLQKVSTLVFINKKQECVEFTYAYSADMLVPYRYLDNNRFILVQSDGTITTFSLEKTTKEFSTQSSNIFSLVHSRVEEDEEEVLSDVEGKKRKAQDHLDTEVSPPLKKQASSIKRLLGLCNNQCLFQIDDQKIWVYDLNQQKILCELNLNDDDFSVEFFADRIFVIYGFDIQVDIDIYQFDESQNSYVLCCSDLFNTEFDDSLALNNDKAKDALMQRAFKLGLSEIEKIEHEIIECKILNREILAFVLYCKNSIKICTVSLRTGIFTAIYEKQVQEENALSDNYLDNVCLWRHYVVFTMKEGLTQMTNLYFYNLFTYNLSFYTSKELFQCSNYEIKELTVIRRQNEEVLQVESKDLAYEKIHSKEKTSTILISAAK